MCHRREEAETSLEAEMTQLAAASQAEVREKNLRITGRVWVQRGFDGLGFKVVVQ
jgi:hypothetical protein